MSHIITARLHISHLQPDMSGARPRAMYTVVILVDNTARSTFRVDTEEMGMDIITRINKFPNAIKQLENIEFIGVSKDTVDNVHTFLNEVTNSLYQ